MAKNAHLLTIDASTWPGLVNIPTGRLLRCRARKAEAEFAQACDRGGINLDGDADLVVVSDLLFQRVALSGWLGLAESYMAGEWTTPDSDALVRVLTKLIAAGYNPKTSVVKPTADQGGELPAELVDLYAGDGVSSFGGLYASGVPTTIRESLPNYARNSQSKTHFVDVTSFSDPVAVEREDLADAQRRMAVWLAESARIIPGDHILSHPAGGAQVGIVAAQKRATVDIVSADSARLDYVREQLELAGAHDAVATQFVPEPVPTVRDVGHRYDAIVSVEKFEIFTDRQRRDYVAQLDRLLVGDGRLTMLTAVATDAMSEAALRALSVLRAYVWPGVDLPAIADVHKTVERYSHLRITGQTHFGSHFQVAIAQQRSYFAGRLREAAAAGFDAVFRRLWMYQFAVREALLALGMMDVVGFTALHRHRGGRR